MGHDGARRGQGAGAERLPSLNTAHVPVRRGICQPNRACGRRAEEKPFAEAFASYPAVSEAFPFPYRDRAGGAGHIVGSHIGPAGRGPRPDRPRLRCQGRGPHQPLLPGVCRRRCPNGRIGRDTILFRDMDRRARGRRHPQGGVRQRAGLVAILLRGHAHGRSSVAAHRRHHAHSNCGGLNGFRRDADIGHAGRRARHDVRDQRQADGACGRGRCARHDPAHFIRPLGQNAEPQEPGPPRRHQRACQRNAQRGADRPGLHARNAGAPGL